MPNPAAPGLKSVKGIEFGASGFEDVRRKPQGNECGSGTGKDLSLQPAARQEPQFYNCKELNSVRNLNDLEVDSPPHPLGRNAACQYTDFGPVRPAQDI